MPTLFLLVHGDEDIEGEKKLKKSHHPNRLSEEGTFQDKGTFQLDACHGARQNWLQVPDHQALQA